MNDPDTAPPVPPDMPEPGPSDAAHCTPQQAVEIGGRNGPDPTRFGDWEKNGRCVDF